VLRGWLFYPQLHRLAGATAEDPERGVEAWGKNSRELSQFDYLIKTRFGGSFLQMAPNGFLYGMAERNYSFVNCSLERRTAMGNLALDECSLV
jgi:hypothetical protein